MTKQADPTIANQWIEKAENALRNATIVVREPNPPTDTICFHCHQVAEKYLKAFLIAQGIPAPKVHDLRYLVNLCLSKDDEFSQLKEAAGVLNNYYIESRYPLDLPNPLFN